MSRTRLHILATVLLLASLVLLVLGLGDGPDLVWNIGVGLVAMAMLFAFATQWVEDDDREEDGREEEEERARGAEAAGPNGEGRHEPGYENDKRS